jgi:Site-specific DNA methylase
MRYHGGKFRLAPWIISHFPQHRVYVEPFGGAAGVLLRKPRSSGEVYNDLDGDVVNLFRVMRDDAMRKKLIEQIVFTPYSRDEFVAAWEESQEPVERARRLLIRAEMGFGSAGATKGTTGFRMDAQREYGTVAQVWARVPEALAGIGQRLKGVIIENRDAIKVLSNHDSPDTLFFVDPPYVHSTRKMGGACYRHEMTDDDHVQLLDNLRNMQGMVVLSGYPHPMYEDALKHWQRIETQSRIAAGRGTGIRTEVLWLSPNIERNDLLQHAGIKT